MQVEEWLQQQRPNEDIRELFESWDYPDIMRRALLSMNSLRFFKAMYYYQIAARLNAASYKPKVGLILARHFVCDWCRFDKDTKKLKEVVLYELWNNMLPTLSPYHSLFFSFPGEMKRLIASAHSLVFFNPDSGYEHGRSLEGGRLRVGYVRSHFGCHSLMESFRSIPGLHDRSRFEVFCYRARAGGGGCDDENDNAQEGSGVGDGDCVVRDEAEHFVDLSAMTDKQAADRVYGDGIHVLVDLNGYTEGARPGIFGWRPAPIQVQWIAFPGTMGSTYIDYVISDEACCPLSQSGVLSERLAYMPISCMVGDHRRTLPHLAERYILCVDGPEMARVQFNDSILNAPDEIIFDRLEVANYSVRHSIQVDNAEQLTIHTSFPLCIIDDMTPIDWMLSVDDDKTVVDDNVAIFNGKRIRQVHPMRDHEWTFNEIVLTTRFQYDLPSKHIVFCNHGPLYRLDPLTLRAWARILKRMHKEAVLWLLEFPSSARDNVTRAFDALGISPDRLCWAKPVRREEAARRVQLADVYLDTPRFSGTMVILDALWAGTLVVTMAGNEWSTRTAASMLSAYSLEWLITKTWKEYEEIAVRLALDRSLRLSTAHFVHQAGRTCPLFDTPTYVRNLETLFGHMWRLHEAGAAPQHLGMAGPLPAAPGALAAAGPSAPLALESACQY